MSMHQVMEALRRSWIAIVVSVMVFAAVATALTAANPPRYTATADRLVSVNVPSGKPQYVLAEGSQYILDRMTSYAQLGVTTNVLTPVVRELNLPVSPLTLSSSVSSQSVVNTAVLEISAEWDDPLTAARIADSVAQQVGNVIEGVEDGKVKISGGPALVPGSPSNHHFLRNIGVGAAGGLGLGLAAALLIGFARGRFSGENLGGTAAPRIPTPRSERA